MGLVVSNAVGLAVSPAVVVERLVGWFDDCCVVSYEGSSEEAVVGYIVGSIDDLKLGRTMRLTAGIAEPAAWSEFLDNPEPHRTS